MDEILSKTLEWMDEGHKVAFATVIATWGSSPVPVGSQMAINERGNFAGSVSGGCIESFVVSEAIDIIETGKARLIEYGVTDEQAREVKFTCGGSIKVFVEPAPTREELKRLINEQPINRVVDIASGDACLILAKKIDGVLDLPAEPLAKAREYLSSDSSEVIYSGDDRYFSLTYAPPRRIVIIGAVHISQALIAMAGTIGFEIILVDPRPLFTRDDRIQSVTLLKEHPSKLFEDYPLDRRTAVVALAHDPDLDDPAITAALRSQAFYIGALGGKRNNQKRLDRFAKNGFSKQDLERIHAPVGLDIGGRSPAHIALSILAEIISVGNGKSALKR